MERATAAPGPHVLPELGEREFGRIRKLLESHTGVHLSDAKAALVMARLGRRLRELRLHSYRDYLAHIDAHPAEEISEMVDRLLTNETRLFREGWQFDFLEQTVIPLWRKQASASGHRGVKVWSAACSTGEEPASLAAVMSVRLPAVDGFRVSVLATDLSTRALAAARTLSFAGARGKDIPPAYSSSFEAESADRIRLRPVPTSLIQFEAMNLLTPSVPPATFDLILCRNVLIYFARETKRQVIDHLWRALKPGGFLFVGHAETLVGVIEGLRPVKPAIYQKPAGGKR